MTGQGAYGLVPNLPLYTTDTSQTIGTDAYTQLLQNLPGYAGMVATSAQNISDMQHGRIGRDELAGMYDLMNARSARGGLTPGSPNINAALLRLYGQTEHQRQLESEPLLTAAIQRTPVQPTSLGTQTTDLAAIRAQLAAAPDPYQAAMANLAAMRSGLGAGRTGGGSSYNPYYTPATASTQTRGGSPTVNPYAPPVTPGGTATPGYYPSAYTPPYDYGQAPTINTGILGGSDLFGGGPGPDFNAYSDMMYATGQWGGGGGLGPADQTTGFGGGGAPSFSSPDTSSYFDMFAPNNLLSDTGLENRYFSPYSDDYWNQSTPSINTGYTGYYPDIGSPEYYQDIPIEY